MKTFAKSIVTFFLLIALAVGSFVNARSDEIEELSSEIENKENNLKTIEEQIKADQARTQYRCDQ